MDNEVKEILMQLVEGQKQMSADISNLKEGQKQLFEGQKQTNERLDKMDNRLDEQYNMIYQLTLNGEKMQNDISNLQSDVKSIKVTLENDISPAIKMLSELQLDNSKRFRQLEKDVQEIKDNSAIDEVIHELKDMKMI